MEFEHYHSNNPTFLGVYSNLLSTDARCLVIKLGVQYDMVDFALYNVAWSIGVNELHSNKALNMTKHQSLKS